MKLETVRRQVHYLYRHPASQGWRSLARFAAWQAKVSAGRDAVVPYAGGKFYCPSERRGMAKVVYLFGDRYEGEVAILDRVVRPGMTVLDIGANYGTYTIPLARIVGAEGRVIAIEPSAHAVAILQRNIALNDLTNVIVIRAAVTETVGDLELSVHPDPARTSLAKESERTHTETVPGITIDSVRDDHGPIDFIKIDVEGAESMAFRGARGTFNRDQPVVLFESAPEAEQRMGLQPGSGWQALRSHGYEAYNLGADKPERTNPNTYVENVFAYPLGRVPD
jgi:FkbM family methyltransferase